MKKKISILLLCLCVLSLFGCQKEEPKETKEPESTQVVETEEKEIQEPEIDVPEKKGILIALDPGHQGTNVDMSAQEPNAPGSTVYKMKATQGTNGQYTGVPEYELNLDIAMMLKERLEKDGYDVIMTREDHDTAISNSERACLANDAGADISIRIHANGSSDPSANGALALIGSEANPYVGHLYGESYRLAEAVLQSYCNSTGMANCGIQSNDTMTGINWSQIPVMILEMGFMTNEQDDTNMADPAYRELMVSGILDGINSYYGYRPMEPLEEQIRGLTDQLQSTGATAAVYVENLENGLCFSINDQPMESASLIKLYVASCVYETYDIVQSQEMYPGETEDLLSQMITVSDNDATNLLTIRLGEGDAALGMERVNQFCETYGFEETHMGRLMMAPNPTDDNRTSVQDTGTYLRKLYEGKLPGSEPILEWMKQQQRISKLPAGVPEGVQTANKTGELTDVENDVAIVFAPNRTYSVCVMTSGLLDTYQARMMITEMSRQVYEYVSR